MKTQFNRNIVWFVCLILALLFISPAHAGRVHPGAPIEMEVDVHLAVPLADGEGDILEEKLKEAALMICDATDGRVKVSKFWLNASDYSSHKADMFIWPPDTFDGGLVRGTPYPFMFGRNARLNLNHDPALIGHELAHLLLGLEDQYSRAHESAGCGVGYPMDRRTLSPTVNSIMMDYDSYCFDAQGDHLTPPRKCESSIDCLAAGGTRCAAVYELESELNTAPHFVPWLDKDEFPGIRAGEVLHLDAVFGPQVSTDSMAKNVAGRRLFYLNEDDQGKAREYGIELSVWREDQLGYYFLEAELIGTDEDDNETSVPLEFEIEGISRPEVAMIFGTANTCTLPSYPTSRGISSLLAGSLDSVKLVLPGDALIDVQDDVKLDVDLDQVCQDPNTPWKFNMIARSDPDPETGEMTGSFIGASPGPNQSADYLQLGDCKNRANERFNASRQQWVSNNQWKHVANLADEAMDAFAIEYFSQSCEVTSDCDVDEICVHGSCFAPLTSCNHHDAWCGAELLVDGNDWDLMRYTLMYDWPNAHILFPISLSVPRLSGDPEPDPSLSGCHLSDTTVEHSYIGVDQVVVLADRSASMGDDWGDSGISRFDMAARAIAAFAGSLEDSPTTAMFGVFNSDLDLIDSGFNTIVSSNPGANQIEVEDVLEGIESFNTGGSTAIGDAIDEALTQLASDGQAPSDAIFLITDGQQTSGDLTICEAATQAVNQRVRIWFAPINTEFPYRDFACIAVTGGSMLRALDVDEAAGALFELKAKNEGQQLSRAYERSALAHALEGFPSKKVYKVAVEEEAEALSFQINPMASSADSWDLRFTLFGPDGTRIEHTDESYVQADSDGLGYSIRVPNPQAGLWKMKLKAPPLTKFTPESQVLMARVENHGPKCQVEVSHPIVTEPEQAIRISARARWGATIESGATYTAMVQGPDGSLTPLVMVPDDEGGATGIFDSYEVDGTYVAHVRCNVADDATLAGGEDQDGWHPSNGNVPDGFDRLELAPIKVQRSID